jgi:hypothetical protein
MLRIRISIILGSPIRIILGSRIRIILEGQIRMRVTSWIRIRIRTYQDQDPDPQKNKKTPIVRLVYWIQNILGCKIVNFYWTINIDKTETMRDIKQVNRIVKVLYDRIRVF